jgi:2-polyprenyl-6-methoxyphenol hydroxylase-like FAD-dependent oxidoreductase
MTDKITVLVAGAGPVGLTMAAELRRYGVGLRIIDKSATRTDKSKALVLWSRSLELIERMGCVDRFLAAGVRVHGARISRGLDLIGEVTFDEVQSRYPFALMIPQSETERLLEERLEESGSKVERLVELAAFAPSPDGVTATLRHSDGAEEEVEADWLIGCDGAHSTVRHGLGIEFQGSTQPSDWALADLCLDGLKADKLDIFWHAKGILVFFPIVGDRYRVIADLGPSKAAAIPRDPTLEEMQTLVDIRGPGNIRLHDPYWLAGFRINERKVEHYQRGRVFLAGDAAHVHSPAGGQGMNTGMQDAFNLAWKLAMVAHGQANQSLLDSYSIERSAVGDRVLRNATQMTDIAVMRNPVAQTVRNFMAKIVLGLSQVQHRISNSLTELEIAYPHSPLTVTGLLPSRAGELPKAGERWPIATAGDGPIGAGNTPRFALIADGPAADRIVSRFADLAELRESPKGMRGLWVVRPDGYVGLAASSENASAAEAYLANIAAQNA